MNRALCICLFSTLLSLGCNVSDPITNRPVEEDTGTEPDVTESDMGRTDMSNMNIGNNDAGNNGTDMAADVGVDMNTGTTLEEYCEAVSRRRLEFNRECYNSTGDPEDPELLAVLTQDCLQVSDSIAAGHTTFSPDEATTCVEALDALTCDNVQFIQDYEPCENVLTSNQTIGDPCYPSTFGGGGLASACAEGYCLQNSCPGECTAYASIGEDCGGSPYINCDPNANLWCNFNTNRCESRLAIGVDCSGNEPCREGLICLYNSADVVCAQALEIGDACDVSDDRCLGIAFCSEGVCKTKAATGEECRYPFHCPYGDSCVDDDGPQPTNEPGVCRARGAAGASCFAFSQDCQDGLFCMNNTCVALPSGGEPCVNDQCAPGFWCRHEIRGDEGICRTIGGLDEDCSHGYGTANVYTGCNTDDDVYCIQGTCRQAGAAGDPCAQGATFTCQDDLFCQRETNVCVSLAAEGNACNPWWNGRSCQDGFGCSCDPDSSVCGRYNVNTNPGDTCQPLRAFGELCSLSSECESNSCYDHDSDGTNNCQPGFCDFP